MKKIMHVIFLLAIFTGCATVSQPKDKSDSLQKNEGVIIFSTIDDGSTDGFPSAARRATDMLFTLGTSEIGGARIIEIHFAGIDDETNKLKIPDFFVVHDYTSSEFANTKKWHILKLKPGSYVLTELTYKNSGVVQTSEFSKGAYYFNVNAGESLYIGDFKLAFRHPMQYEGATAAMPVIVGSDWRMDDAMLKIAEYPNYPSEIKKAKVQVKAF